MSVSPSLYEKREREKLQGEIAVREALEQERENSEAPNFGQMTVVAAAAVLLRAMEAAKKT